MLARTVGEALMTGISSVTWLSLSKRKASVMHCLDVTLPTPEENLACDEALVDEAELHGGPPVLRFWQFTDLFRGRRILEPDCRGSEC